MPDITVEASLIANFYEINENKYFWPKWIFILNKYDYYITYFDFRQKQL